LSNVIADFVQHLLETDWSMGRGKSVRIIEVDVSSLGESPPVLRLLTLIGVGGSLGPQRWRLALKFDPEDVQGLAEPSYRHAMADMVVPANIMEWWDTRDNPVVVSAEEDADKDLG
jgi:hypothetical protein